ncbi:MAG: 2-oxoglutarate dehydrogenase complex dihydrolipoyllysine-residue succinyltransferase [Spirochaetales bacterium]
MKTDVTVPEVGESVASGVLAVWLKKSGDVVTEGEDLFELETDKATLNVPAPATGVLEANVEEDTEVEVGQSVGSIDTSASGEDEARQATQAGASGGDHSQQASSQAGASGEDEAQQATQAGAAGEPGGRVEKGAADRPSAGETTGEQSGTAADAGAGPAASDAGKNAPGATTGWTSDDLPPGARRVAAEHGVDVSSIAGTGKGGRVTKEDVLRAVDEQSGSDTAQSRQSEPKSSRPGNASAPASGRQGPDESGKAETPGTSESAQTRKKLTSLRKRVAANLVQSKQNAAHLTTFNEVDMSRVMEIRSRHKERFEKKHDVKLGFMSFFVKASEKALAAYPEVNAFLEEEEIVYNHFYNIGVALSSDRGLMTPVIRNVESRSFADIERQIIEFMEKAKNKRIMPDELTGGTFTISNGGVFGSMLSTPIPNPPQTAILGMHSIQKRPVVVDDEIVVRPMMYLALSYDHRMIDGREAIGFLNTIKEAIEDPTRMLLGL